MNSYTAMQVTAINNVFKGFLIKYHGFTMPQAVHEASVMWATPASPKTKDEYIFKTSRVGSAYVSNRKGRLSIYASFESAQNHGTFFDE